MLMCVFGGSTVLGARVGVVAKRVEDETAAVAEAMWPIQSGNSDAEELAEPRLPLLCVDGRVSEA